MPPTKNPKPTPAQLEVLRKMGDGAQLLRIWHVHLYDGTSTLLSDPNSTQLGTRIHGQTFNALFDHHWICNIRRSPGGGGTYTITPSGLAALEKAEKEEEDG